MVQGTEMGFYQEHNLLMYVKKVLEKHEKVVEESNTKKSVGNTRKPMRCDHYRDTVRECNEFYFGIISQM